MRIALLLSCIPMAAAFSTRASAQPSPDVVVVAQPSSELQPVQPDVIAVPQRDRRTAFTFGIEGGVNYFTENGPFGVGQGIGESLFIGSSVALRASFEIFRWLAIDGRLSFTGDDGNTTMNQGRLMTFGGFGAVRLTLPIPYIRPYVLGGFGGYDIFTSGTNTMLTPCTVSAFEVGVGVLVPVGARFQVGAEYLYSHLNNEVLSSNAGVNGGDPTSIGAFVQYRLPI